MSKIEEMASISEYNGTSRKVFEDGFIIGANSILREIEKVLVAACEQYTSKQAVALNTEIYNKIKELKGE